MIRQTWRALSSLAFRTARRVQNPEVRQGPHRNCIHVFTNDLPVTASMAIGTEILNLTRRRLYRGTAALAPQRSQLPFFVTLFAAMILTSDKMNGQTLGEFAPPPWSLTATLCFLNFHLLPNLSNRTGEPAKMVGHPIHPEGTYRPT